MVTYGVVGTGYFGAELARFLHAHPGAEVTVVHDPEHAEAVAAEVGARVAPGVAELCAAPDVDVVVVASPNNVHREPAVLAARAGKHVFCEKPIALSYADCAAMVDAAQEGGVHFVAGHVMRFMAGVRRVRGLVADGVLGDLVYGRAVRTGWEDPVPTASWKKRRELSGGHLYHHIHELDVLQALMGPARAVSMTGGNVVHAGEGLGDEDDVLLATLEMGEDRFATLELGSAFRWPEHYVLVEGTRGAVRIDLHDSSCELRTSDGTERFGLHRTAEEDEERRRIYSARSDGPVMHGAPTQRPPLWLRGIIEEELTYVHDLVAGRREPEPEFADLTDGSAATAAIATADALTLAMRERRWVTVDEVRDDRA